MDLCTGRAAKRAFPPWFRFAGEDQQRFRSDLMKPLSWRQKLRPALAPVGSKALRTSPERHFGEVRWLIERSGLQGDEPADSYAPIRYDRRRPGRGVPPVALVGPFPDTCSH